MKIKLRWLAVLTVGVVLSTLVMLARQASVREQARVAQLEADVRYACSYCHAYPQPETIPQALWRKEVSQAYSFIADSDIDLTRVPPMDETVAYFENAAPKELSLAPELLAGTSVDDSGFHVRHIGDVSDDSRPGISNINVVRQMDSAQVDIVACDMRNGEVLLWPGMSADKKLQVIGRIPHPARSVATDLDQDGHMDLLVADLGHTETSDDRCGQVVWLRGQSQPGKYVSSVLASECFRVADVRAADFDNDQDLDLVVAEFGGQNKGRITYLENRTVDWDQPLFVESILDDRAGTIHVPIADINGDGKLDFIALISQQHEVVVAFLNQGGGRFDQAVLFDSQNPGYGSAGIELADIDGDEDLDVLFVNGDTLDFQIYRPYHSLQWLENEGDFPFRHHHLMSLPGGMAATTVDFDQDGDLDVVTGTFLPFGLIDPVSSANILNRVQVPSLAWLEQVAPGEFQPHVLETNGCTHASVATVDVDGDGAVEVITGHMTLEGITQRAVDLGPDVGRLSVWKQVSQQPSSTDGSQTSD